MILELTLLTLLLNTPTPATPLDIKVIEPQQKTELKIDFKHESLSEKINREMRAQRMIATSA